MSDKESDITTWKFLAFCAVFGIAVGLGVIAYASIVFISEPWDRCDGVPIHLWWGCLYDNRNVFQNEDGSWTDRSGMWVERGSYSGWAKSDEFSCFDSRVKPSYWEGGRLRW